MQKLRVKIKDSVKSSNLSLTSHIIQLSCGPCLCYVILDYNSFEVEVVDLNSACERPYDDYSNQSAHG